MTPTKPTVLRQVVMAVIFLVIVASVAAFGSLATIPNTENGWYADAVKVAWSPPNWLFGPAWSLLYFLIAVSGFLLWRAGYAGTGADPRNVVRNRAQGPLTIYAIQMILNLLWTPVFFAGYPIVGAAAWWAALIVILVLIGTVVALIIATAKWSKLAAWLLVPYLAWLLFATSLNIGIIALN